MIKIYGPKQSTTARCLWLMEELGQPYENVSVNMQGGEHKSAEYLKLNPNGKVPTMVDGEFVLWESMAINYYLTEKFRPALFGATPEERALTAQWSFWAVANMSHALEPLILKKWRNLPDSEETVQALVNTNKCLQILETYLTGRDYVVGTEFTLADLNLGSAVSGVYFVGVDMSAYPNIVAWLKRLMDRPAYKKLMGAEVAG